MGIAGVLMMVWRSRAADQPIRLHVPAFWDRWTRARTTTAPASAGSRAGASRRVVVVIRVPHLNLPMPRLLDLYISREYLRVLVLGMVGLLGIFYIATFIDLVDKLFRGDTTSAMLMEYFYFRTPQFVYYVIPMAVLVATLVTVGLMTKNSELLVMRACGISLYRTAAPLFLFGALASAGLFLLQERALAPANREADRLERVIRSWGPATSPLSRRWIVGRGGEIYHYDVFDPEANRFTGLWVYRLDDRAWRLSSVTRANEASLDRWPDTQEGVRVGWTARSGWTREIGEPGPPTMEEASTRGSTGTYMAFTNQELQLEPPTYFKNDEPIAELMTYVELRDYISRLRASGANIVPQLVALQRKVAFPFVTIIMTLLAVPFAVTTGRRGAMYGIGVGLVLAIVYWVMLSVSGALGAGGVLSPVLAAWTPNILFGAAAAFGMLTVRT
jgi:lipopolysaccharide export LptBFGC system permease protein LptF